MQNSGPGLVIIVQTRSGKYKLGARASKYKSGVREGNANWRPGPVNTNWGPGPVNTNWGPGLRPGAKQRAGDQEIQIPIVCFLVTIVLLKIFLKNDNKEKRLSAGMIKKLGMRIDEVRRNVLA